ncbi:MAG: GTP cyclohydrolase II [Novosphingobium sp.]
MGRYSRIAETSLPIQRPNRIVECKAYAFHDPEGDDDLLVLVHRPEQTDVIPIVRLHSTCVTGDALGSARCDCRFQLDQALERITASQFGILVYLNTHEGRGIGLMNKIRAYALQEEGRDTVDANTDLGLAIDAREYTGAVEALRDLGVTRIKLMTNNPEKIAAMTAGGIEVVERLPVLGGETPFNGSYLETKKQRMNHMLDDVA